MCIRVCVCVSFLNVSIPVGLVRDVSDIDYRTENGSSHRRVFATC